MDSTSLTYYPQSASSECFSDATSLPLSLPTHSMLSPTFRPLLLLVVSADWPILVLALTVVRYWACLAAFNVMSIIAVSFASILLMLRYQLSSVLGPAPPNIPDICSLCFSGRSWRRTESTPYPLGGFRGSGICLFRGRLGSLQGRSGLNSFWPFRWSVGSVSFASVFRPSSATF